MEITLVTALAPFDDTGGAERTIQQWLDCLADRGHHTTILTYGESTTKSSTPAGHTIKEFDDKAPLSSVSTALETESPDVVITQGGWSDIALWAADNHAIPSILLVMSEFELQVQRGLAENAPPDHIITVSDEFRARAKGVYRHTPVTAIYQPIDFEYYSIDNRSPECYTLINPVESKGGFLFKELATRCPDRQFLTKMGWSSQRNEDHSFSADVYDIFSQTIGTRVAPPVEPDFGTVPNVESVREGDIRDIYRRTKMLVVPSQWQEAFGRVIIEAMHNGIPVIASEIGGIPEACGGAGVLVEEHESVEAWIARIDEFEHQQDYDSYARQARQRAATYRDRAEADLVRFADTVVAVAELFE